MSVATNIIELLNRGIDDAPALMAPGRTTLTYAGLRKQVTATVECLNVLGVGRNTPVAMVLPNGPEMAGAFVSVSLPASRSRLTRASLGNSLGVGA